MHSAPFIARKGRALALLALALSGAGCAAPAGGIAPQDAPPPAPVDDELRAPEADVAGAEVASPAVSDAADEEDELPPLVARPEFMRARPELPDLLLRDKREGRYVTGFPAIGYDDEKGGQLGAVVQWYDNGARDDPYFRSTPYRANVEAGAVGGSDNSELRFRFDHPYVFETPYRLRVDLRYLRSDVLRYFGTGDDGLAPLSYPGAPGETFDDYGAYKDALAQVEDGTTWAKYDEYSADDLRGGLYVERDGFGGIVRFLAGLEARKVEIDDYTGDLVGGTGPDGEAAEGVEEPTHLFEDHEAGLITGFDGGWDNFLKLGVTVDTRDFEPDPSSGVLGQVTGELSTQLLGSDFDYQRVTTSVAGYYSPLPDLTRLILAGRALYTTQFGEVPFFALNALAFNNFDRTGLGGYQSIRGYKTNRFIGQSAALLNAELRWSFAQFRPFSQDIRLGLATFYDTGRSFEDTELQFEDWRSGYGFGLILAWNLATIIRFDSAYSEEDQIFYLELGHSF